MSNYRILEIDKSYLKSFYSGNKKACIDALDGILFTPEVVNSAFGFGHGTKEDLMKHIANNRKYCFYYDLDSKCYI